MNIPSIPPAVLPARPWHLHVFATKDGDIGYQVQADDERIIANFFESDFDPPKTARTVAIFVMLQGNALDGAIGVVDGDACPALEATRSAVEHALTLARIAAEAKRLPLDPTPAEVLASRSLLKATDVAKLCEVDLKTIHNWVDRSYIPSFRTPGRHLRFKPADVAAFLRSRGFNVPASLAAQETAS